MSDRVEKMDILIEDGKNMFDVENSIYQQNYGRTINPMGQGALPQYNQSYNMGIPINPVHSSLGQSYPDGLKNNRNNYNLY